MKLDISDIIRKKSFEKDIDITVEESEILDGNEPIKFLQPMRFIGKISINDGIIKLEGELCTKLKLICSRCLEEFEKPITLHIDEDFTTDDENKDDENIFIDSDVLDITEILENNVMISLPMKKLCKEDCKGLCQNCGTNLNYKTCNCGNDDIDPRFAKLKDLFASN